MAVVVVDGEQSKGSVERCERCAVEEEEGSRWGRADRLGTEERSDGGACQGWGRKGKEGREADLGIVVGVADDGRRMEGSLSSSCCMGEKRKRRTWRRWEGRCDEGESDDEGRLERSTLRRVDEDERRTTYKLRG